MGAVFRVNRFGVILSALLVVFLSGTMLIKDTYAAEATAAQFDETLKGLRSGNIELALHETYKLFDRSLDGLLRGNATLDLPKTRDPEIRLKLNDIQKMWKKFRSDIAYGADSKNSTISNDRISSVAGGNLPLLDTMDQCVKMYEEKAGR